MGLKKTGLDKGTYWLGNMVTMEHIDDNPLDFGTLYGSKTQVISSFVIYNIVLSRALILQVNYLWESPRAVVFKLSKNVPMRHLGILLKSKFWFTRTGMGAEILDDVELLGCIPYFWPREFYKNGSFSSPSLKLWFILLWVEFGNTVFSTSR